MQSGHACMHASTFSPRTHACPYSVTRTQIFSASAPQITTSRREKKKNFCPKCGKLFGEPFLGNPPAIIFGKATYYAHALRRGFNCVRSSMRWRSSKRTMMKKIMEGYCMIEQRASLSVRIHIARSRWGCVDGRWKLMFSLHWHDVWLHTRDMKKCELQT